MDPLLDAVSIQICPKCQESYRLHGVSSHQQIYCFKCGGAFESKENEAKKGELVNMQKAAVSAPKLSVETEKKRQGGTWTWLLFFTFILYCLVKAVSQPPTGGAPTPSAPIPISTPIPAVSLSEAIVYFDNKDYAKSFAAFESVLQAPENLDPKVKLDCLWKLAFSAEKSGNLGGAVQWNQKLVQEFEKEKDWRVHAAKKALGRLTPLASIESKNP